MIRVFALFTLATTIACDPTVDLSGTITVDDSRAPAAAVPLRIIPYEVTGAKPATAPLPYGMHGSDAERADAPGTVQYEPGTTEYQYSWGCGVCAPDWLYVFAFADTNGDGLLSPGELFGEPAENPLRDPSSKENVIDIALDQVAPSP